MIRVDLFFLVLGLFMACGASAWICAWIWGRAVKRDALEHKEWILKNTVFRAPLISDLRAFEMETRAALLETASTEDLGDDYWKGKLQAFRDVIVKLGGKIYE
jgi:hypothetical protein